MVATAGILNQQMASAQALAGAKVRPMDSSTSGTGSSGSAGSDSATISANDFLTLLVTEMQNQDPTATTDPNEYINQLVQVNSLEQLIGINQTLSGALGSPTTSSSGDAANQAASASSLLNDTTQTNGSGQAAAASQKGSVGETAISAVAGKEAATRTSISDLVSGNLGIPAANPAANRVAHALDGQRGALPSAVRLSATR